MALLVIAGGWLAFPGRDAGDGVGAEVFRKPERKKPALVPPRERPPRYRSVREWQREVEALLGGHEAARTRLLSRKESMESELYLLGVEPPSEEEIRAVREQVDSLTAQVALAERAVCEEKLAEAIRNYDPFGAEGRRVIQIDIPHEPNGRLTGFTCSVDDFEEIVRLFQQGEMIGLERLRGYGASYAGMPLSRFDALIVMDEPDEPEE